MSRIYGTVEPSVIDDEMLTNAVFEQGPKGEAGKIAKEEGVNFADVLSLRLDYKNILKIDNLWCFTNLTKLQLDNNIIERIEGIDHLVHLRWLDLSFNNIEYIEGLSTLTQLEDLTLYQNRISRIENLDSLTKLQIFSIGNNRVGELENLIYFRKFKHLKALNLAGNPVCQHPDYHPYIYAFLYQVVYLDYKLIDAKAREMAMETKQIKIEEMEANERADDLRLDRERREAAILEEDKAAMVEYLNGPFLFDSLYSEDQDGQKMSTLPGVSDMLQEFREKFVAVCVKIFELGKEEYKKRENEVAHFWECILEAKEANKKQGIAAIEEFNAYKTKIIHELTHADSKDAADDLQRDYNDELNLLWKKLMCYEMQLVDQLEETIKEFERNLGELCSNFLENTQGLMAQCRDMENQHNERMTEQAMVILEKVLKNEIEEEISEDLRVIFVDKDTVVNALQASHDMHLQKIDNREDEIASRVNLWKGNLLDSIHQKEEIDRNRERVMEITHLVDHLRDEVYSYELPSIM